MSRFILLLLCSSPLLLFAQSEPTSLSKKTKYYAIIGMYQNGYVFPTNSFLKGTNSEYDKITSFQSFSVKYTKQTIGKKLWEQLYNYPNYGVGLYFTDFHNPEEIGHPFGIYGFFNAPFKRWSNLTLNYELGFGTMFNWKSFNPITNKYNIAIGAGESFIIDAGINLQYFLTKKIILEGGFSLTHFSNGALKEPNFGINTMAPKISLKYNFKNKPEFQKKEKPKYNKQNEFLISFYGAKKNVIVDSTTNLTVKEKYEGVNFPVFGISALFNRQVSYKSKFGLGMSVSYNSSINAQYAVDNNEIEIVNGPFFEKLQLSVFPSYELVINKLSIVLQPSFYLYRKKIKTQSPTFYQKLGLRYQMTKNIFSEINLRAYQFHVSDFIEWTIGYRINWR